jgi:hypothetical protein
MFSASRSNAQESLTPLYLSITGQGSITPFQNGQLLEVGQNYDMTATPDVDYVFSSWQPVNVFITTISITNFPGEMFTITNMVFSPVPDFTDTPTLNFTMQPQLLLAQNLWESSGWQANFVATPEPSVAVFSICATIAVVLRRWKWPIKNAKAMLPNTSLEPTMVTPGSLRCGFRVGGSRGRRGSALRR